MGDSHRNNNNVREIPTTKKHIIVIALIITTIVWITYVSPANLSQLNAINSSAQIVTPNYEGVVLYNKDYSKLPISQDNKTQLVFIKNDASGKMVTDFYVNNNIEENKPTLIADDNQTGFWSVDLFGSGSLGMGSEGDDYAIVKKGANSYKVNVTNTGTHAQWRLIHGYGQGSEKDWSKAKFFALWWYGSGSGFFVEIRLESGVGSGLISWYFLDNYVGWERHVFCLNSPQFKPTGIFVDTSKIRFISIGYLPISGTWYLDRIVLDEGLHVEMELDVPGLISQMKDIAVYSYDPNGPSSGKFEGPVFEYDFNQRRVLNTSVPLFFLDGSQASKNLTGDALNLDLLSGKITHDLTIPPHDALKSEAGTDSTHSGISQVFLRLEIEKHVSNYQLLDIIFTPYYLILILLSSFSILGIVSFFNVFSRLARVRGISSHNSSS
jgi:hypothetical protein